MHSQQMQSLRTTVHTLTGLAIWINAQSFKCLSPRNLLNPRGLPTVFNEMVCSHRF